MRISYQPPVNKGYYCQKHPLEDYSEGDHSLCSKGAERMVLILRCYLVHMQTSDGTASHVSLKDVTVLEPVAM